MPGFIPKKLEKDVISIRIPTELLKKLDERAAETGISRNELINQCITYALQEIKQ